MHVLLLALLGCGLPHRVRRVLAPVAATTAPPAGQLAAVSVEGKDGGPQPYAPEPVHGLAAPVLLTRDHRIHIAPEQPVSLQLYVRNFGALQRDFFPIQSVTGARPGALSDEVRFLPDTIEAPTILHMADLTNVHNGYRIRDDDLLLVALSDGETTEHYLFQSRRVGLDARLSYGLMLRSELTGEALSPAATAGMAVTWRRARLDAELTRALDSIELLGSLGLGTSTIEVLQEDGAVTDKIETATATLLGGGGVVLFESITVQLLTPLRDPQASLAVGIDTGKLAVLTRDLAARLLDDNTLSEP